MNNEQTEAMLRNLRAPLDAIVEYASLLVATEDKGMQRLYADIIDTNRKLLQQMMMTLPGLPAAGVVNPASAVPSVAIPETEAESPIAGPAVASAPAPDSAHQTTESTAEAPDRPTSRREKTKLLIAEDNESNYFLFQAMLEDDYELIHAWDGLEAVELFKQHNPGLILMDINMPRMDGYEATREIRKLSAGVPIIAVTAYVFASDKERIMEIGFNGYVSKPVDAAKLESEIAHCRL